MKLATGRMARVWKAIAVGLITGLLGAVFGLTNWGGDLERSVGLTWLFHMRGAIPAPDSVAVVAINGQTGGQLGLPSLPRDWSRTIHAKLVDELTRRGASAILFDVQFDKAKVARDDQRLAQAVRDSGRVGLIELITGKRQPLLNAQGQPTGSIWVEELVEPLPMLVEAATGLATFPLPKIDASVYEFWVFKDSLGDAATLPALALQIQALPYYADWLGLLNAAGDPALAGLPKTRADIGRTIPLKDVMNTLRQRFGEDPDLVRRVRDAAARDRDGKAVPPLLASLAAMYSGNPHRILNFYGPPGTIRTVPYQAVIKGDATGLPAGALDFQGKVVFVGFSDLYDPGHPDRFYTVFTNEDGVDLSGVEIAATAFGNLSQDSSIKPLGGAGTILLLFTFGLTLGALAYYLPAIWGVPLALAVAAGYAVAAQWLFNGEDHWLPLAIPLLGQFPLALFLALLGQYFLERRRGQRISEALGYYLPESVARDLTENRADPQAFNKVVYGTCLATDMSGFSTISEQLPPDQLAVFLNDYFDTLAGALKAHHVDVTEFRADAIMCAWTGEKPSLDIRRKAVLAALSAAQAIEAFKRRNAMLKSSLRIGLEAGHFYIGHAGGGGHFVFSIVGDTANTASRVESLNKHVGTSILATEEAVAGLDDLLLRPIGQFQFMGKTEAIPILEILATRASQTGAQERLVERFAQALELFHQARWADAQRAFEAVLADHPEDGPSRFYATRCQTCLNGGPAPEDPRVIRMDAK